MLTLHMRAIPQERLSVELSGTVHEGGTTGPSRLVLFMVIMK